MSCLRVRRPVACEKLCAIKLQCAAVAGLFTQALSVVFDELGNQETRATSDTDAEVLSLLDELVLADCMACSGMLIEVLVSH